MKILLLGEYSGLNNELKRALIASGHDVTLAAANDFFKAYPTDISLGHGSNIYSYKFRQFLLPLLNLKKLAGYDVVHIVNFYILPRIHSLNLFLIRFLKQNNGIVTLAGAGSDPFFVRYSESTMRYSPIPPHETYDRGGRPYYMRSSKHLQAMHQYMQYVDGVIPIMYEYYSTFCAAGYADKTYKPVPIPIDCNSIRFTENSIPNGKIVFFHGLNRPGFKGTFLIEKCFTELSKKYPRDVECVISGKMPFNDYMQLLARVNVSVDQVFSYSLAMNALYSLAQGKLVCGGAEPESSILYGGVLPPAINLVPDAKEIVQVLEQVLDGKNNFLKLSEQGRAFVESFHSPTKVAMRYTDCWSRLGGSMNENLLS